MKKLKINFKEILANIIGHIQGDGCISFRRNSKNSPKLYPWLRYCNSCKKLIKLFVQKLTILFPGTPVYVKERRDKRGIFFVYVTKTKAVEFLIKMGANKKEVPKWIKNSPISVKAAYLRALFDDDGTVYHGNVKSGKYTQVSKSIKWGSASEKLANGVYKLLVSLGMRPRKYIRRYRSNYGKNFSPYFVIELRNNLSIMKYYNLIGFDHPIKKEKLKNLINDPRIRFKE
jgi:intein/homing endonuclease